MMIMMKLTKMKAVFQPGELIPDSDDTDFDEGDGEDFHDSADFENEVIVVCRP